MTTLRLTEDDGLAWFETNWTGSVEVEFTDDEVTRIRAAFAEYESVQALIYQRVNGYARGTYPDEPQP